jgi:hypothetical protein
MQNNQLGQSSGRVLSSEWTGLSTHLIAKFYTVKRQQQGKNVAYVRDGDIEVHAPLTESNVDITLNWQSPFENMSPDQAAIEPVVNAIGERFPVAKELVTNLIGGEQTIQAYQGRTGITKLNSTQVFSGMPPAKITAVALFRAWKDPAQEVEAPFAQLMQWALPVKLSPDGVLVNLIRSGNPIASLLPSQAPQLIAMEFKRNRYLPLVIESIGQPLGSPIDSSGKYTELLVPITLATLTAIDRDDMRGFMTNGADGAYRVKR